MFLQYLKRIRFVLLWSLLCAGIFFLIFVLEEINLKAAVYPTVLCLAFGLLFLLCGYLRYKKAGRSWNICCKEKDLMRIHFRWHKMGLSQDIRN